jgi:pimeloyl-ACP methyl ester carboxylesterase
MDEHSLASLGPNGFHRIAYTEWGDRDNPRIVICMHGLTRNRHDFDYLAAHLAGKFRVVAMDVVGRGDSEWLAEKNDYRFSQYVTDAAALIARVTAPGKSNWADRMRGRVLAEPGQVDWIGTSMGGLIGMMLAAKRNTPIRRLVLNDVGPLVPWSGLVQLKGQASRQRSFETLEKVEAFLREACAGFGKLSDDQWRHMAQHGSREQADGKFVLSYDPDIMRGFGGARALDVTLGERLFEGVDLWPVWDKISCPTLVLRGAESDVLTERTVRELKGRGPPARVIEFPGVGHAPALMDAAQIDPIRHFLLE